jgi:hypothetical protein
MGACSWAPAVEINYDFHHFVTAEKLDQLIGGLQGRDRPLQNRDREGADS